MQVKGNTYITIQAFMVNELHLSGNELIIYAAIFGFSQDGESWFTGSRSYLAAWCQASKKTISNNLAKLVDKGLIEKRTRNENGVTLCDYRVGNFFTGVGKKLPGGREKITTGGREKVSPHTIEVDNLEEEIERDIEKTAIPCQGIEEVEESKPLTAQSSQGSELSAQPYTASSTAQAESHIHSKADTVSVYQPESPYGSEQSPKQRKAKEPRHRHGEYGNVLLSDSDLSKLKAEFPNDWQERIERLGGYMASTGKSYKNHLATIRNWARRDKTGVKGVESRSKASFTAQGNQGWTLEVKQGQTAAEAQAEHHRNVREQNATQEWTEDQLKAFAEMGI